MVKTHTLKCVKTGRVFADDGLMGGEDGVDSLLRAVYENKKFTVDSDAPGLYRFANWLPVDKFLGGSAAPVSFLSERLAARLGLKKFVITFSGYWPERGAFMKTGSFKECEAYSVCARFKTGAGRLVVASAGNTARAFYRAACENGVPVTIVVPEKNFKNLFAVSDAAPNVAAVAVRDGDYFDAITLADKISGRPGFVNEGGAKNVARRDGMGTTILSAAEFLNGIPDVYVQAIGSGTGAIAAHEANLRLNGSGDFPAKTMRMLLVQNSPFTPIADAYAKRSREIEIADVEKARKEIAQIDAATLSNRKPPYAVCGGLFDALTAAGGEVNTVTNAELRAAAALFLKTEGCDICAEAGAALAALMRAAGQNKIGADETVMLNVTGGGYSNIKRDLSPHPITPDYVFPLTDLEDETAVDGLCERILNSY